MGFGDSETGVRIPALPLPSCVSLDKAPALSEPVFPATKWKRSFLAPRVVAKSRNPACEALSEAQAEVANVAHAGPQ